MIDNRFLEIEQLTKKNFKECLTYLSYMLDYNAKQQEDMNAARNRI